MTKKIYQIQIALKGSKPKIWRRILVDSDVLLVDFHRIIQTTMGWTNSHLHMFSDGIEEYSPKEFEVEDAKDSRTVRLNKILKSEKYSKKAYLSIIDLTAELYEYGERLRNQAKALKEQGE